MNTCFGTLFFSGEHCLQITCAGHSRRERRPVICFTPLWHSESSFCWQISCINLDINITLESEMINWSSAIGSKERNLICCANVLYFAIWKKRSRVEANFPCGQHSGEEYWTGEKENSRLPKHWIYFPLLLNLFSIIILYSIKRSTLTVKGRGPIKRIF